MIEIYIYIGLVSLYGGLMTYLYLKEKKAKEFENKLYASMCVSYLQLLDILSEANQELEATKAELELYINHEKNT